MMKNNTSDLNPQKVRVLSVDDDEMNQVFIKEVLSDRYEVMPAMDGEEALEVLNQFKPDVILLDVMMPGMSGYDVCRAIRNTPKHGRVKIIFTSAKTRPKEREEGYVAGGNDYIAKPFSYDELIGKVNIFSQMQLIEDQASVLSKENVTLKAQVQLLQFLNHARRHYRATSELAALSRKLTREFLVAMRLESVLFMTSRKGQQGVGFAIVEHHRADELVVDANGLDVNSGAFAEIMMNYKPTLFSEAGLSAETLGLPTEIGVIHNMLGISFLIEEDLKGVICLINKENKDPFTAGEHSMMEELIVEVEHAFRCK